jgi:hypothetical protein
MKMNWRFGGIGVISVGLALTATSLSQGQNEPEERRIPGFERVLPRGAIASIDDPTFVTADAADIDPDAWVLGAVIDGQARAYSLNLLNHHEVVNDEIAGQSVAAVW